MLFVSKPEGAAAFRLLNETPNIVAALAAGFSNRPFRPRNEIHVHTLTEFVKGADFAALDSKALTAVCSADNYRVRAHTPK